MKKHLALFVVLCFVVLTMSTTGAFAGEYYVIGLDPVQPDRTLHPGECMGKWNFPVRGQMGTRTGFRGDKALSPLTPLIFDENLNGQKIPARSELVIYMCGNGFRLAVSLDTLQAVSVECFKKPTVEKEVVVEHPKFIISGNYVPSLPTPTPPPAPVVKRHSAWPWIVVGAILVGVALSHGGGGSSSSSSSGPSKIQ